MNATLDCPSPPFWRSTTDRLRRLFPRRCGPARRAAFDPSASSFEQMEPRVLLSGYGHDGGHHHGGHHHHDHDTVQIVPTDAKTHGKTLGEWAAKWSARGFGTPAAVNPILDETGANANINQSGPVWFLDGNFGGLTQRDIEVPEGKAIFVPVVNFTAWGPEDTPSLDPENWPQFFDPDPAQGLANLAAAGVDPANIVDISASVDGVQIMNLDNFTEFRASHTGFEIPPAGIGQGIDGAGQLDDGSPLAAVDGYWFIVRGLSEGSHEIDFHATIDLSDLFGVPGLLFTLELEYDIEVVDEKSPNPRKVLRSIVNPNRKVKGQSIDQWTAEWWEWVNEFSKPNDPISDTTGELAGLNQSGPVFFVAGSGLFDPSVDRQITVPEDKYILLPLVNLLGFPQAGDVDENGSPAGFHEFVRSLLDEVQEGNLFFFLDGVPAGDLTDHRHEAIFSPDYRADSPIGPMDDIDTNPVVADSITDGYWIMLKPLKEGTHTLDFGGNIPLFAEFGASGADLHIELVVVDDDDHDHDHDDDDDDDDDDRRRRRKLLAAFCDRHDDCRGDDRGRHKLWGDDRDDDRRWSWFDDDDDDDGRRRRRGD